jgi:manganese efflux pump family protein
VKILHAQYYPTLSERNAYIGLLRLETTYIGDKMDLLTVLLIAVGLAMDAFAVSIAKGIVINHNRRRTAFLLGGFFGGFQMLMPAIGWLVGLSFKEIIMGVDHWIAFGLLAFIGSKMIYDSTRKEAEKTNEGLRLHSLLILAIATSIDALMVGLSFAFLNTSILEPILVIGLITFVLSVTGFFFGCGLGRVFGNKIKIVGGLILIVIGLRILLEHIL